MANYSYEQKTTAAARAAAAVPQPAWGDAPGVSGAPPLPPLWYFIHSCSSPYVIYYYFIFRSMSIKLMRFLFLVCAQSHFCYRNYCFSLPWLPK